MINQLTITKKFTSFRIVMGSVGNPQSWVPYQNTKDCSQGFCSLYCPQWCYIIFPPPPPYEFPDEDSGTNFSPLVIAIIGILASAFLLVSYYTVISKYCGNLDSRRRRASNDSNDELNENQNNPSNNEPWQVSAAGLDEALIKSITVCKYSKKGGFVDGTDCSVCLSEFEEDESLRLLPKCSHAFHLTCIDTWLKSHSNCPLCRANIIPVACPLQVQLPPLPPPVQDQHAIDTRASTECEHENHTGIGLEEFGTRRNSTTSTEEVSSSSHTRSDLWEERDAIIEIRDEGIQPIRRSVSMDSSCRDRASIADVLGMNQDGDSDQMEEDHDRVQSGIGSSNKRHLGGESKSDINRRRALHCVTSPIAMKRSISSGRFLFSSTRHGRGRNVILPM